MPQISIEQFLAFVGTDPTRRWPCGDGRALTVEEARGIAVSALYSIGEPAITTDREAEAFARWYAASDTKEGRDLSSRAIKAVAFGLPADHFVFSWGEPGRGWGEGACLPTQADIRRLNTWIRNVLADMSTTDKPVGPVRSGAEPGEPDHLKKMRKAHDKLMTEGEIDNNMTIRKQHVKVLQELEKTDKDRKYGYETFRNKIYRKPT